MRTAEQVSIVGREEVAVMFRRVAAESDGISFGMDEVELPVS